MSMRDWYRLHFGRAAFEREKRGLWPRVWLIAAREADLAEAGDYVSFDVADESALIVRGDGGELRAFHNVCSHRGTRLCPAPRGRAEEFRCPYHGWCYGTDGTLRDLPAASEFPGIDRATRGLRRIPCESWAGFVWVAFDEAATPLSDFLGPVRALVDAWRLDEHQRLADVSVELACNWKLSVDAHNESYHVANLHPEIRIGEASVELLGPHAHLTISGGDLPATNHLVYVFPNVQLNVHENHFMLFRHRPDARDMARCAFDQQVFGRDAGEARGDSSHRWVAADDPVIGPVTAADLRIAERVQLGMASTGFAGPVHAESEAALANMYRALEARLGSE